MKFKADFVSTELCKSYSYKFSFSVVFWQHLLSEFNDLLTQGVEISFEIPYLNHSSKIGLRKLYHILCFNLWFLFRFFLTSF